MIKTMTTRHFSRAAVMLLLMLLTTVSAWATDDSGSCGTNVTYTYVESTHTLTISGTGAMADYDLEGAPWYSYCSNITTVIIGSGVTSIGSNAFVLCNGLTSVTIPNSVTSIGDNAFMNCFSLTSIEIPASVTSIGSGVFASCFSLASISVASGNTKYHSDGNCLIETATNKLIAGCKTSVIPTGVTSIGYAAFNGCSALTNIEIPDDVTSIGRGAFYGCTGLTSITIPNSVTSIGSEAFNSCSSLTSVTFGNSVTSIGDRAFYSCSSLTSIEIPASVTSIGYYAFWGCSALSSVIIYAPSLDFYGTNVFDGNASGRKIYVPMASLDTYQTNWSAYAGDIVGFSSCGDNVYYAYDSTSKTLRIFGTGTMWGYYDYMDVPWNSYCDEITTIIIGNGVTHIGDWGFSGCSSLTSITIPNSVTNIGNHAFNGCSALTSITIPNSVTSIDYRAFYDCRSLTSVTFGNSVTSIGGEAFRDCTGLTSIEIPASVTSIGKAAFAGCTSLASISVASGNTKYHSDGNCIIETATKTLIQGCKNSVIPDDVTSIGDFAFSGCTGLTSIEIPASVTSIGNQAFIGCSGLESISVAGGNTVYDSRNGCNAIIETASNTLIQGCKNTVIPDGVTSIGGDAFLGCGSLTSITIPNSVTSIGLNAFRECTSLTSIEIPASVTSIGNAAFDGCWSLTSVIIYAPSLTYYGDYAFHNNKSGRKIYVPMASLGTYQTNWSDYAGDIVGLNSCGDNVYYLYNSTTHTLNIFGSGDMEDYMSVDDRPWADYCGDITTVVIGNGVTSIGRAAFLNCSALTSVSIPACVTSIGGGAFKECTGLTSITIPNSVTIIGEYAFACCSALTSVTFPANLTTIGDHAFWYCTALTSVEIPYGVTTIGDLAFNLCFALTSVTIPNSVTSIGNWALSRTALTSVEIPASVTSIGQCAFGNYNLAFVTIYATSVPTLGSAVFDKIGPSPKLFVYSNCVENYKAQTSELNIDADDILPIDGTCGTGVNYSYDGTSKTLYIYGTGAIDSQPWASYRAEIKKIVIGDHVTSIGEGAFGGCSSLLDIVSCSDTPPSLGSNALNDCDALNAIYVHSVAASAYKGTANWSAYENKIKGFTGLYGTDVYYAYDSGTHELRFFGRGAMVNHDFPQNTPWYIEGYYKDIKTAIIENGVTSIGECAFRYCTGLTSIEIPASVTSIIQTFSDCFGLETISVADGNTVYDSRNNCNAIIETASNTLIWGCKNTVIPDDVTSIGSGAFTRCTGLTSIEIPASVTSIGIEAFFGCSALTSVTIYAPSLTYYGEDAFDGNADGRKIYVPAGSVDTYKEQATTMGVNENDIVGYDGTCGTGVYYSYDSTSKTLRIFGSGAMKDYDDGGAPWYSHCADITKVVISNGVTSIGSNAFFKCNNTGFTTIAIPASVTNIGDEAFWGCTSLTDVYYYANPTQALLSNWDLDGDDFKAGKATKCHVFDIDDWDDFKNTNVTFVGDLAGKNEFSPVLWGYDNGTQTLTISGTGAMADYNSDNQPWKDFRGNITSVVIEDGVTSIGDNAFKDCSSLATVTIYAPELTYYGEDAFSNNASGRKIYVFSDCVETYKAGWSGYAADILPIEGIDLTANAHDGNYWTTFYCGLEGFEIKDGENACAYTATVSGDQLTLHKLGKVIPKGTAVIIVGADNSISMTASTEAAQYTVSNDLQGTDIRKEKSTLGTGTFYVMGKVNGNFGFFQYTADYMPARKAYLLLDGDVAQASSLTMVFDNETTEIKTTDFTDYTDKADTWYSLDGRKLDKQPTAKGIYIHNGRKEVVR